MAVWRGAWGRWDLLKQITTGCWAGLDLHLLPPRSRLQIYWLIALSTFTAIFSESSNLKGSNSSHWLQTTSQAKTQIMRITFFIECASRNGYTLLELLPLLHELMTYQNKRERGTKPMEKELAQSDIPVRRKFPKTTRKVTFWVVFGTSLLNVMSD